MSLGEGLRVFYAWKEKCTGNFSDTRVNCGRNKWCSLNIHALPCISQSPLQLDWDHVTTANQWTVSMRDTCHFQAQELRKLSPPFLSSPASATLKAMCSRWHNYRMEGAA